jgi:hypothetical protein
MVISGVLIVNEVYIPGVFSAVFCTFACSNLTIGCLSNFRQDQPI